jgi:hypothetical protein
MPKNDLIFKRLKQGTNKEREAICNILGLDSKYYDDISEISKEFRSISGHTIANTFRDSHALEYIKILKDTYFGIETWIDKELKKNYSKKGFNKDKATEYELENEIDKLITSVIKNICNIDPISVSERLKKEIIACGKADTRTEAIVGGGGLGLVAKLISLPVSIGVGTVQALTTPTYRKTYLVTLKLIDIKRRVRAEEKLKD